MREEDLDDVVQGLAVAKYALEAHDERAAAQAIDTALATAKRLLTESTDPATVARIRSRKG